MELSKSVVLAAPSVTSYVVNGGAVQRSRVTTITIDFASPVLAEAFDVPGAITITRTENLVGPGDDTVVETGAIGTDGNIVLSQTTGYVSSVTLTFDNADGNGISPGVEYGSLADCSWRLSIPSAGYTTPDRHYTGTGPNGTAPYTGLYRLFGDINGNATVTAGGDQIPFDSAFGMTDDPNNLNNGYNAAFDFNNDGTITAGGDQIPFDARFGTTLS